MKKTTGVEKRGRPVGLTKKEYIELRIKCLEPFIATASKLGIENDTVIEKAEIAWRFATRTPEKPAPRQT